MAPMMDRSERLHSVVDLSKGHIKAIEKLNEISEVEVYNLGTGKGYSVLDIINNFSKACEKEIDYRIAPRRSGDIAMCYADPSKAREELHWEAVYDIDRMC
jgi:UDP-glucose 4-epimerase